LGVDAVLQRCGKTLVQQRAARNQDFIALGEPSDVVCHLKRMGYINQLGTLFDDYKRNSPGLQTPCKRRKQADHPDPVSRTECHPTHRRGARQLETGTRED